APSIDDKRRSRSPPRPPAASVVVMNRISDVIFVPPLADDGADAGVFATATHVQFLPFGLLEPAQATSSVKNTGLNSWQSSRLPRRQFEFGQNRLLVAPVPAGAAQAPETACFDVATDDTRRIAGGDRSRRNVPGDDAARTDDRSIANAHTRQNDAARADEAACADMGIAIKAARHVMRQYRHVESEIAVGPYMH